MPWRRDWQPTLVFLPGEFHGERSLAGCSSWGHKESDTTERLSLFSILGGILEIIWLLLLLLLPSLILWRDASEARQEDDLLQDWWQNTGLLCSHPLQRFMGINKLYYSAIRSICTYQKTCGLTAVRSMAHSQTSSLPWWKIALLFPRLPLPRYLGLVDILSGLITTPCLLPFALQVVLKRTRAWYWKEGKDVWEAAVLRHLRILSAPLSAGLAFLKDEHIWLWRFPRQAHSCQHDPWTSRSGIWTCYWKGLSPGHTH